MNEEEYKFCIEFITRLRNEARKREESKTAYYKKPKDCPRYCKFADMSIGDVFDLRGLKYVKLGHGVKGISPKDQPSNALCLDNMHYISFAPTFDVECKLIKSIKDYN